MTDFTADVRATFAEIAHAQKGHELGFNVVRAELRDLKGGMSQVVTKTQELESAMEAWGEEEEEGFETWDEEQDDAKGWTLQQAQQVGDMLLQRQRDEGEMDDLDGDDAYSAPDGAAQGKPKKKTKLAQEPDDDDEDDWQGEDDDDWDSSEADPLPHLDSGSDDDDISVPGLSNSNDDTPETAKQKREK